MGVEAVPTPGWLSSPAEVMSREGCWTPTPPHPIQCQAMRIHYSERGGGPEVVVAALHCSRL